MSVRLTMRLECDHPGCHWLFAGPVEVGEHDGSIGYHKDAWSAQWATWTKQGVAKFYCPMHMRKKKRKKK